MLDPCLRLRLRHALPRVVLDQLTGALSAGQPPAEVAVAACDRLLALRPALPLALARELVADALEAWQPGCRY